MYLDTNEDDNNGDRIHANVYQVVSPLSSPFSFHPLASFELHHWTLLKSNEDLQQMSIKFLH